jgi:hypothetical protein
MANPFTVWPPSDEDLAWAAGIMEGEGSFYQLINSPGVPELSIGMNDEDVIAKLAKIFGVDYNCSPHKNKDGSMTNRYKFVIHGRSRAGRIMSSLHPYMSERRKKQIEKALEFPDTPI